MKLTGRLKDRRRRLRSTCAMFYNGSYELRLDAQAKGVRQGDSGGPLFDSNFHQIAIASYIYPFGGVSVYI